MAPIAYNEKTGEAVRFDNASRSWIKTEVATNPTTGARVAFDGLEWRPVAPGKQVAQEKPPSNMQMAGEALGYTAGKVIENVRDLPKTMGRQATELGRSAEKTARFLVPAYGALTLIPSVRQNIESVFDAPGKQYALTPEEEEKLSKENVPEKTLRAAVELAPQLILFHKVSGGGRLVAEELKPVVEQAAKKYGYSTIQEALPVISKIFGAKTPQTVITAAGNAIGFGGYEGTKTAALTGDVGQTVQATAGGMGMGLMPLATAAAPTALKPAAAAAAGAGLAALGGADVKEIASSGLLWGAMEMMGLKPDKDPKKAPAQTKTVLNGFAKMSPEEFEIKVKGNPQEADLRALYQKAHQAEAKSSKLSIDQNTGLKYIDAYNIERDAGVGKKPRKLVLMDVEALAGTNKLAGDVAQSVEGDQLLKSQASYAADISKAQEVMRGGKGDELVAATDADVKPGRYQNPNIDLWTNVKGENKRIGGLYVTAVVDIKPGETMADAWQRLKKEPGAKVRPEYKGEPLGTIEQLRRQLSGPPKTMTPEFTSIADDLKISIDNQKEVFDALRTESLENAQELLGRKGIPVSVEQLRQLEPLVKGGAGLKREAGLAVASSLAEVNQKLEDNFKRFREEQQGATTSVEDAEKKLNLWSENNAKQYDESVSQVLRAADLTAIEPYIRHQESMTGGGLRLKNEKLTELADRFHGRLREVKGDDAKIMLGHADIINERGRFADAAKNALDAYYAETDPVKKAQAFKASKVLFDKVRELNLKDRELATAEARLLQYRKSRKDVSGVTEYVKKVMSDQDISKMTDDEFLANVERFRGMDGNQLIEATQPTVADVLMSGYYASMLSGISTHAKNVISTGINTAQEQLVTAMLQASNVGNQAAAIARGMKSGVKGMGEAFTKPSTGMSKFDLSSPTTTNAIIKVFDVVGKTLSAEDAFFKAINYESSLSSLAYEKAKSGTTTKVDFANTYKELMDAPTDDMIRQARYEAARNTFNQTPEGMAGNMARQISRITEYEPFSKINPKWNFKPGKLVVPFTRVVANVLNAGIDWTPLGLKRAFEYRRGATPELGDFAQRDFSRQMTRVFLGTTVMSLLYGLADKEDAITGSGPRSKTGRETLRLSGWRPNSVKIGETYVPYYNLGPSGLGLAIIGNFNDAVKYGKMDDKDAINKAIYAMLGAGRTLLDQSFLTGISSVMQALQNGDEKALYRIGAAPLTAINPNLIRQVNDFFDDKKYDKAEKFTQYLLNEMRPVGRLASQPEPRVNLLGEEEQKEGGRFGRLVGIPVIKPEEKDYTPVLKYISKAGGRLSGTKAEFTDPTTGELIKLDGKMKTEFEKARGQNYRANLIQAEDDITSSQTRGELQAILNQGGEVATQDAIDYMLDTFGPELDKYRKVSKQEQTIGVPNAP